MQEDLLLEIYQKRFRELIKETHTDFLWPYKYNNFKDLFTEEEFKTAIRVKCRKRNRRRRCFKKLEPIIRQYEESFFDKGEYCVLVFGTCTFDNEHMKWKEESRTKKVNKWLKKHFPYGSLANIDYGGKNGREHHHFIGITYELVEPTNKRGKSGFPIYELKNKDYELGFEPDLEIINDLDNEKKLSNYLVKLNYHSNKKTTKNRRIRYLKR